MEEVKTILFFIPLSMIIGQGCFELAELSWHLDQALRHDGWSWDMRIECIM